VLVCRSDGIVQMHPPVRDVPAGITVLDYRPAVPVLDYRQAAPVVAITLEQLQEPFPKRWCGGE
jgi:hypothetical protein